MDYKLLSYGITLGVMWGSISSVNSQTLEQAVAQSLQANPSISIHINRYHGAVAAKEEVQSGYLPSIDLNAGYGRERTDSPATRGFTNSAPRDFNRGTAAISIKQMLFDGFEVSYNVAQKESERLVQQYELYLKAQDLALEVSSIYLDTIKNQQIVTLSQENISQHQKIYKKIALRVKQGVGSQADLNQIRGRLSRAQVSLVGAEHNFNNASARYLSAINSAVAELIVPKADQEKLAQTLGQLTNSAKQFHPKLMVARHNVDAKKRNLNGLASNYYPKLSLELNAGFNNNLDGTEGYSNDAMAMVKLDYNLFSGGRDKARQRRGAYQWNEAKDNYNNEVRLLTEKGHLALNSLQSLQTQLSFLASHVKASELAHRAYQQQYDINKRTLLDLLDSSNELFQARKSYINTEFNQLYAQYRVLANMGVLLDSLRVNQPAL